MNHAAVEGGFIEPAVQASKAFRTALDVMARPGSIRTLSEAQAPSPVSKAAASLLLTLCDADTTIYLAGAYDFQDLRDWIAFHIGAQIVPSGSADFALGAWADLRAVDDFPIGSPEYPDRSTTLIVDLPALENTGAVLRGPGIKETAQLNLPEIAYFAENATRFPLGNDFFFCAQTQIAALARSTKVEAS